MEFLFTLSIASIVVWSCLVLFTVSIFETDFFFGLVFVLLCALGLYFYKYEINPFLWTYNNLATVLIYIFGYFVIGVIWSFPAFFLSVRKEIKKRAREGETKPSIYFDHHYWKIANYILFWPISILSAILTDLIRDICELIAEYFKKVYKKIFDYQMSKL